MGDLETVIPLRTGRHSFERVESRQDDGDSWLSLQEVSGRLGIPPSSLRRYLDRHGRYLPTAKAGKKVLIARSALPLLERIRTLYDAGRTVAAVEDDLGGGPSGLTREEPGGPTDGVSTRPPMQVSQPQGAARAAGQSPANGALAEAEGATVAALQQQVTFLEHKLSEMQASIESRDLMIRQILSAVVHVIEAQDNERRFTENERQIADDERDRQSSHRHQQVMLSLQEILGFTRRRRWLW